MKNAGRGFTLIEVLFAFTLLTIVSTGLAAGLVQALRARATSRDLIHATALAADTIERVRAGIVAQPLSEADSRFERHIAVAPFAAGLPLNRIEVTVSWNDGHPQQVELRTLLPQ